MGDRYGKVNKIGLGCGPDDVADGQLLLQLVPMDNAIETGRTLNVYIYSWRQDAASCTTDTKEHEKK
jgi:hypothetical protein